MIKMLIKDAGTALLAMCLGVGWIWSVALEGNGTITARDKVYVAIALTLILVIQQVFLWRSRIGQILRGREMIIERKPIIKGYLDSFLSEYYELREGMGNQEDEPVAVRANVMLPEIGLMGTCLKMFETACPPMGDITYSPEEKSLKWKKGQGTCGWAWGYGGYRVFDSQNDFTLLDTLNTAQSDAVLGLNAIISFPINYENNVVGVLSLDSQQTMEKTKLSSDVETFKLIHGSSKELGVHCHIN